MRGVKSFMKLLLKILSSLLTSYFILVVVFAVIFPFIPGNNPLDYDQALLAILLILASGFLLFGVTGIVTWALVYALLKNWSISEIGKHSFANISAAIIVVPIAWLITYNFHGMEFYRSLQYYGLVFPVSILSLFIYWALYARGCSHS